MLHAQYHVHSKTNLHVSFRFGRTRKYMVYLQFIIMTMMSMLINHYMSTPLQRERLSYLFLVRAFLAQNYKEKESERRMRVEDGQLSNINVYINHIDSLYLVHAHIFCTHSKTTRRASSYFDGILSTPLLKKRKVKEGKRESGNVFVKIIIFKQILKLAFRL